MPSGQSAGFARGLAGVLQARTADRRKQESEQADRDFTVNLSMFGTALQHGIDTGDYSASERIFELLNPEQAKQLKKQGGIGTVIAPIVQQAGLQDEVQAGGAAEVEVPSQEGAGGPGAAAAPPEQPEAAAGSRFYGMSLGLSPEERRTQAQEATAAAQLAPWEAKMTFARRLVEQGAYPTLQGALAAVGVQERTYGRGAQSVKGEMPDGTAAFGVFDPTRGQYLDPTTQQPLEGFRPQTTTGSQSLGQYAEQAARDLGHPTAQAAFQAGAFQQVMDRADEIAASRAGATTTGRGEAAAEVPLSTQQRFQATTDLATEWRKIEAPQREMARQLSLMNTGLERFREGDKIGGSQAVLVTFQKILDPTSVVRESEYARTPAGLGLLQRLQGAAERLGAGGAGVPEADLAEMVATAQAFVDGMATWNDLERDRIRGTAEEFEIDPERVFGVADAATGGVAIDAGITLDSPIYIIDGRASSTPPGVP